MSEKQRTLDETLRTIKDRSGRSLAEHLERGLKSLSPADRALLDKHVADAYNQEQATPPRIAVIGKCGVGKSSTINALFGTGLPTNDVVACTQEEIAIAAEGTLLDGMAGTVIVYDMPGLGEDVDADKKHRATYARVLSKVDVALWVVAADERVLGHDQQLIHDVVAAADPSVLGHIVIGINKVDTIQPGAWFARGNMPSAKQRESIAKKIPDVKMKLAKVVPRLENDRIIEYSAHRHYRTEQLFTALMRACSKDRAWVLKERKGVTNYLDTIDPELRLMLSRSKEA